MKDFLFTIGYCIGLILLSWVATVGIIKLITLCFGLKFSLLVATGIWLVMILVRDCFIKISR